MLKCLVVGHNEVGFMFLAEAKCVEPVELGHCLCVMKQNMQIETASVKCVCYNYIVYTK